MGRISVDVPELMVMRLGSSPSSSSGVVVARRRSCPDYRMRLSNWQPTREGWKAKRGRFVRWSLTPRGKRKTHEPQETRNSGREAAKMGEKKARRRVTRPDRASLAVSVLTESLSNVNEWQGTYTIPECKDATTGPVPFCARFATVDGKERDEITAGRSGPEGRM